MTVAEEVGVDDVAEFSWQLGEDRSDSSLHIERRWPRKEKCFRWREDVDGFDDSSSSGYFRNYGGIGADRQELVVKPFVLFVDFDCRGRRWVHTRASHHWLQSETLEVVCCV